MAKIVVMDHPLIQHKIGYVRRTVNERVVFIVDPMLATGGSSSAAVQMLKDKGIKNIRFICIIAVPEGLKKMKRDHPDIDIYIVPGLGDAGDRIFGTK